MAGSEGRPTIGIGEREEMVTIIVKIQLSGGMRQQQLPSDGSPKT